MEENVREDVKQSIVIVENFLTALECEQWIREAEADGADADAQVGIKPTDSADNRKSDRHHLDDAHYGSDGNNNIMNSYNSYGIVNKISGLYNSIQDED